MCISAELTVIGVKEDELIKAFVGAVNKIKDLWQKFKQDK